MYLLSYLLTYTELPAHRHTQLNAYTCNWNIAELHLFADKARILARYKLTDWLIDPARTRKKSLVDPASSVP